MDERQQQIREGAGLDEAKLNQEFIDALRKWGPHVLMVLCLVVAAYSGWTYLQRKKAETRDTAFRALVEAQRAGNVQNLIAVGRDHPIVANLARLSAADGYLAMYRTGLAAGAQLDPATGQPTDPKDLRTDEQRQADLKQAEDLYRAVAEDTRNDPALVLHTIGAVSGLAAVAESRGEIEAAKGHYERVADLATKAGLPVPATTAKERIATLGQVQAMPRLYAKAELATLPPSATPPGASGVPVTGPGGMMKMEMTPDGRLVPSTNPGGAPAPTPVPAPAPDAAPGSAPSAPAPQAPAPGEPAPAAPASGEPAATPSTPAAPANPSEPAPEPKP